MNSLDDYFSEQLLSSLNKIEATLAPSQKIITEMSPTFEKLNRVINERKSVLSKFVANDRMIKDAYRWNQAILDSIPSVVPPISASLNLPKTNIASRIASTIPAVYFPKIENTLNTVIQNEQVLDFRTDVLEQDISSTLDNLFENTFDTVDIENDEKLIDFDEVILKPFVHTKDDDKYGDEITEIKNLFRKIYEQNRENSSEKNVQDKEQNTDSVDSSQTKFLAFLNAFLLIVGLMTVPKEIYEFIFWVKSLLNF